MRLPHASLAVPLIAVFFLAAAAAAETIDREFHQRFDVAAGDTLELHFGDGDVEVTPWDENVLEVHVRYNVELRSIGFSSGKRGDFTVDFERRGDVVRVAGNEPSGVGFGIFTRRVIEYRYTVSAPSYLALDLRGDDGDVRIDGWNAAVSLTSDDGDLALADSRGDLRLRLEDRDVRITDHQGSLFMRLDDGDVEVAGCSGERVSIEVEDGDVELSRCAAAIDVSADDGDVFMSDVTSSRVDVRTADGEVALALDAPGALELEVRTEDGDVALDLGSGVSARFSIDTADGRIRVDGVAAEMSRGRRFATGAIGAGAGMIRVVTQDGGVSLRHGASEPVERMPG